MGATVARRPFVAATISPASKYIALHQPCTISESQPIVPGCSDATEYIVYHV